MINLAARYVLYMAGLTEAILGVRCPFLHRHSRSYRNGHRAYSGGAL